jgi:hypothetical protein
MLDCMKNEKQDLVLGCDNDIGKIGRGMSYEDQQKDTGRGKVLEQLLQSRERIEKLGSRQAKLSSRLKELYDEFAETESALMAVGQDRAKAVQQHVELVDGSRHATSDFMELAKFAGVYGTNLTHTKGQYERGISALQVLEKVLLQEQTFDKYDFAASGNRLISMRKRVCRELNGALNELETIGNERLRRKQVQIGQLDDSIGVTACELEIRKELLDPLAKKYVTRVREMEGLRDRLEAECAALRQGMERQRESCVEMIGQHLPADAITSVDAAAGQRELQRREDVADMREEMAESKAAVRSIGGREDAIVAEALLLQRERQHTGTSKTSSAPSSQKSSRVSAVREAINKHRQVFTPPSAAALEDEATFVSSTAGDLPEADPEHRGARKIRVIGSANQ